MANDELRIGKSEIRQIAATLTAGILAANANRGDPVSGERAVAAWKTMVAHISDEMEKVGYTLDNL